MIYIGYNTLMFQGEILNWALGVSKDKLQHLYKNNIIINSNLYGNLTNYSIPSDTKNLINNIKDNSLCWIFENNSNFNNFSCFQLSTNVTNYGLDVIITYYIDMLKHLYRLEDYKIEYANNNSLYYLNIYYGNNLYYAYFPDDSEELEEYINSNPFNIINDEYFYNINILTENVIKPAYLQMFSKIYDDIKDLFDNLDDYILYLLYFYYIVLLIYFIIYIPSDIYKKNNDINKTKKMLNIIPKNNLYDIFKNDSNIELNQ